MKPLAPVRTARRLVARWGSYLRESLADAESRRELVRDLFSATGTALLSAGSYLIYPPAALLVLGLILLYLGVWHR